MTPKKKASELWNKYVEAEIVTEGKYSNYRGLTTEHARVCALITVHEILQMVDESMKGFLDSDIIRYWKQVKTEIEKL
jgi:hypothetical protein